MNAEREPIHLSFSDKYNREHSEAYLQKHRDGLARRLSHWREAQLARRALTLAGRPTSVLDLPCGAGRFWPVLLEERDRSLIAADNSPDMIKTAVAHQPAVLVKRVRTLETSAFDIGLPDGAVDCIFCMRLFHHIAEPEHRLAVLEQFRRVTRDTVILSLWVGGNFKAWKRSRLEKRRTEKEGEREVNRLFLPAPQLEREFRQAGFRIIGKLDFLPRYSMWRVYVLHKKSS